MRLTSAHIFTLCGVARGPACIVLILLSEFREPSSYEVGSSADQVSVLENWARPCNTHMLEFKELGLMPVGLGII